MVTELGERDLLVERRLTGIEARLEELKSLILEGLVTQLKDHGKRIALLERRAVWQAGWMAGAAAASSVITALVMKIFLKS